MIQQSKLQNYTINHNNSEEYHIIKNEVFTNNIYHFESDSPSPFIIDAGANIGLSVLYFKKLFPGSEILAIEPNPTNFALLEQNIFENYLDDVTPLPYALADQSGQKALFFDATDHNWLSTSSFQKGAWNGTQISESIVVPTITLSELITKPVDFLKLDIEGAEYMALKASQESLHMVKEICLEFHPHQGQSLQKLVELLEKYFTIKVFKGTNEIPVRKAKGLVQVVGKSLTK